MVIASIAMTSRNDLMTMGEPPATILALAQVTGEEEMTTSCSWTDSEERLELS
jgi:hypothetical protein